MGVIRSISTFFARTRRIRILAVSLLFAGFASTAWCAQDSSYERGQRQILVGYFPQWGLYQDSPYTVRTLVESGAAAILDQLNYAQGFVTGGHCSVADPNADLNYTFTAENSVDGLADSARVQLRGNFHQLVELKRRYPRLKILISLEGRGSDFSADAQADSRVAFVASCVDVFLKGNFANGVTAPGLFDGIDVDWEYPRGEDSANYVPLLNEFRHQMDALRPGLRLTVALGASPHMYGDADIARLGRVVDLAGLMTYDFNGPWSSTTGLIAPLTNASPDDGSVETSVASWKAAGIPAAKLLMGLPFYAYGWRSVPGENHGLGQAGSPIRGDRPYYFIETLIGSHPEERANAAGDGVGVAPSTQIDPPDSAIEGSLSGQTVVYRDPASQAPWLFDGNSFWTYEDPISIGGKAVFASRQKLGGFMIWELSGDTSSATLLNAARSALTHSAPEADPVAERAISSDITP